MVNLGLICLQAKENKSHINRWSHTHKRWEREIREVNFFLRDLEKKKKKRRN